MAVLYLGPRLWLIEPPLQKVQAGGDDIHIFIRDYPLPSPAQELLGKILQALHLQPQDITLWKVRAPLSPERLNLFSQPIVWVMGSALFPHKPLGAYRRLTGIPFTELPRWEEAPILLILPSLEEMLQDEEAKKLTWRWIRGLASRS
ncbi:MAG: hypothetical protein NZ580_07675 [Bacteroidia bacterium]|nr:hypothetical protein [Bacteroidia bacterium]MDW8236021.1 hypothetical protein [Bacteroidia bacterium]